MRLHFLNDVKNDSGSTQKSIITPITTSLKSKLTCKLINRIPVSLLLISSLPGPALKMHVQSLGKPRNSTLILKALPGKLGIKRHLPSILYLSGYHILYHLLNDRATKICWHTFLKFGWDNKSLAYDSYFFPINYKFSFHQSYTCIEMLKYAF